MRRFAVLAAVAACGGSGALPDSAVVDVLPDAFVCQSIGALPAFQRLGGNPSMVAGEHIFTDLQVDTSIADPSLSWSDAAQVFDLYYATRHATTYADAGVQEIRHAQSADLSGFSLDDEPSLVANPDPDAWDNINTETPTVVFNPTAPPAQRYLMMYSGANGPFAYESGFPNYAIGAAFSEDGKHFARITADQSPHGQAGLVLTGQDAYPTAIGAIVADPELALVDGTYHLFFSSYACGGAGCLPTAYGIGHATSTDGIHWTVAEAPVASLLFDPSDPVSGGAQPSVIYDPVHCLWEMWISDSPTDTAAQPVQFNNMAGPWHATSTDGVTWTPDYAGMTRDLIWSSIAPGEDRGLLTGPDVAIDGDARYMAYVGFSDQDVPADFYLPDMSPAGFEPAVMTLDIATRGAF